MDLYIIIFEDPLRPGGLRTAPIIYDNLSAAMSRQLELSKLNKQASWIATVPDPRKIAND